MILSSSIVPVLFYRWQCCNGIIFLAVWIVLLLVFALTGIPFGPGIAHCAEPLKMIRFSKPVNNVNPMTTGKPVKFIDVKNSAPLTAIHVVDGVVAVFITH